MLQYISAATRQKANTYPKGSMMVFYLPKDPVVRDATCNSKNTMSSRNV